MSSAARPVPRFRVGDWVSFPFGSQKVVAEIVEDRGLLGTQGRRLYRVRLDLGQDESESTTFEVPEEDLEGAKAPVSANPLFKTTLEYLRQGKQFTKISLGRYAKSRRIVTFTFSDGTERVHTFRCDQATFMEWWKYTAGYLREIADAFGGPDGT